MIIKRLDFFPLWTTLGAYSFAYTVSWLGFGVETQLSAIPFDFLLQLILGYLLYMMSRRRWAFVVVQFLFVSLLYIGSAVKLSIMGGPLLPDDAHAFSALVLISEGWYRVLLLTPIVIFVALLILNFSLHKRTAIVACLIYALVVVVPAPSMLQWMDMHWGNVEWDQKSNYLSRGAGIYLIQEASRYFIDANKHVEPEEIQAAMDAQMKYTMPVKSAPEYVKRNVHLILLESFWDPMTLKKAGIEKDPFDPEFRALWKKTGHSKVLSPVFGGFTANAEFEALCGFPVNEHSVKFERKLRNNVPCLPRILAGEGYKTYASHPNIAAFWNRTNAYQRVGFDKYWSIKDFQADDMMNNEFLSDVSYLRQLNEKFTREPINGAPVFNYAVTIFGHLPFPLNEGRPNVIKTKSDIDDVTKYVNTVYYKTREFMAYIKQLRAQDPDALIVAFGDHLPFLGFDNMGYVESGYLPLNRQQYTHENYLNSASTPLIVINGKKGPVKVGSVPLYNLPSMILGWLGHSAPTMFDYTRQPERMVVRPLPGMHFVTGKKIKEVCTMPDQSVACERSGSWVKNVEMISDDIFMGKQIALAPLRLQVTPPNPQDGNIITAGADDEKSTSAVQ